MASSIVHILGYSGTGMIVLAVLYPALVYRGKLGELYSLLNHFISELGEVGVSRGAWFFNAGLLLSGLVLLPYVIGLGVVFTNILGWLGTAAAIIAVLGVTAVGVFPMNNMELHSIAAMTYFRAGMVMILFFGLAIFFQPAGKTVVPRSANVLSLLAFLAYGTFLALPLCRKRAQEPNEMLDPGQEPERPRFWAFPALEWLVFFSTVAWLFGMTFFI